ncbi:hypothetical protein [Mariniradius sediminis]|uniref:Uncharacterized protein n=1 Tax=Mariniradius sediminis TaxID=2909237 RepID=A0ABS9C0J9_9BACT|nr:hypothetical protein [Mariniradius sediminis]MCF1753192.1 hypothetical protein [Mariniradius sediminis]
MKLRSLLLPGLFSIICASLCLAQEKKLIGKVNLGGDADYILQLHIENEEYIYSIFDVKNDNSELTSFKLIFNDQSTFDLNFKKAINSLSAFSDDFKKKALSESQMYYYALNVIRPALPQDENGPLAMTIKFGDKATVRKISHGKSNFVKENDVRNFLLENRLNKETKPDSISLFQDPKKQVLEITLEEAETRFLNEVKQSFSHKESMEIKRIQNLLKSYSSFQNTSKDVYKEQYSLMVRELEKTQKSSLTRPNKREKYLSILQNYLLNSNYYTEEVLKAQIRENQKTKKEAYSSISKTEDEIKKLMTQRDANSKMITKITKEIDSLKMELSSGINSLYNKIDGLNYSIETSSTTETNLRPEVDSINSKLKIFFRSLESEFNQSRSSSFVSRGFKTVEANDIDDAQLIETKFFLPEIRNLNKDLQKTSTIAKHLKERNELLGKLNEKDSGYFNSLKEQENTLSEKSAEKTELENFNRKIEEFYINQLYKTGTFEVKISNVQLEFNGGFIENMVVMTEPMFPFSDDIETHSLPKGIPSMMKFINQYPLGFSAKLDLTELNDEKLIAVIYDKTQFSLDFKDVVTNVEELLVLDRTDYSPMDGTIKITPSTTQEKELYKNKSTEILQAKVFSDLAGINGEKPNGLIQFEVDKEIPLVTRRYGKSDIISPFRWFIHRKFNVGFFNYIRPEFVVSKIESNLRELELTRVDPNSLVASTLDIRQFEKISVGADLNLTFMDMPFAKSTFYLNAGFRFGRTDLKVPDNDTGVNNTRGFTNTFQFNPEIGYRINGDERYGLVFNYSPNLIVSDERGFNQIADVFDAKAEPKVEPKEENHLHRITLMAYFNFNPGTRGRFFFRFRSFHQWDKWSNNFSQYQLGYSTFITR